MCRNCLIKLTLFRGNRNRHDEIESNTGIYNERVISFHFSLEIINRESEILAYQHRKTCAKVVSSCEVRVLSLHEKVHFGILSKFM